VGYKVNPPHSLYKERGENMLQNLIHILLLVLLILQIIILIHMFINNIKRNKEEKQFWDNLHKDLEDSMKKQLAELDKAIEEETKSEQNK
jgi:predicted Holliday junction resolvase-like endonuclease